METTRREFISSSLLETSTAKFLASVKEIYAVTRRKSEKGYQGKGGVDGRG